MANIYVRSTDGDNADNGSTWALAKATLAGAAAIDAAGDTIYVSQAHSESTAAAITIALAGTAANPVKVICGNDAAEPPTSAASTAIVATTGASNITIGGSCYVYGVGFICATSGAGSIGLGNSAALKQTYESCIFNLNGANSSSRIRIGTTSPSNPGEIAWNDCDIKFSNTAQGIEGQHGQFTWRGGSLLSGGSNPVAIFLNGAQSNRIAFTWIIKDVDLVNAASTLNLFTAGSNGTRGRIANCKLPASWSGSLITGTLIPYDRISMYNCDSGPTNYRLWIEDYAGAITSETTLVRTGGATDGTTPISWKMVSNASTNEYVAPLVSDPISVWQETVGSSITATIEILCDSATNLTDAEVWVEVEYLGTSGYPLGSVASDHRATILTTAADQTTSSTTWTTTGMANPNKQKLSVTFTPQEKGLLTARVYLAKTSTTIYVDPEITVS